ncbi:alpha/beta fold hydrolase [Camelimonas abortus]|uniref:Alpha/beta fold hydrolase n=1 Tax=Camelimonas abortus TaxID=1017184 RepID=A0ABV7LHD0_9HYPH
MSRSGQIIRRFARGAAMLACAGLLAAAPVHVACASSTPVADREAGAGGAASTPPSAPAGAPPRDGASSATSGEARPHAQRGHGPMPTVILTHGELTDGSVWRRVLPLLRRAGVPAVAVQLPLNSMWADVAVVQRALARMKGPVVLVGHSWGGVVITEAGVDPKVAALVYVAGVAPDVGQSFIDRIRSGPLAPGVRQLRTDSSGFVSLAGDAFATDFAQDLHPADTSLLAETQAPVFGKVFEERVNNAAWKTLPVWYVAAGADRMLDPALQEAEAGRIRARFVSSRHASHAAPLSQPNLVASVILEAVAAVRGGAGEGHDGPAEAQQQLPPPAASQQK